MKIINDLKYTVFKLRTNVFKYLSKKIGRAFLEKGNVNHLLLGIFNFLFGVKYRTCKLKGFSENKPLYTFKSEEIDSFIFSPQTLYQLQLKIKQPIRSINVFHLKDVVVNSNWAGAYAINDDTAYIELFTTGNNPGIINYSGGNLIAHKAEHALVNTKADETIEQGIFLGGSFPGNWYHWAIEILPKLTLLANLNPIYKTYPLLVPVENITSTNHKQLLDVLNSNNHPVIPINKNKNYSIHNFLWIDSPVIAPPNFNTSEYEEKYNDYHTNFSILNQTVSKYRAMVSNTSKSDEKTRVFLARKTRVNFNQDEVKNVLDKYNFKYYYFEELTLTEQIRIISNAEIIVGGTGAAWTNMIFAKPGTKGVIWAPSLLKEACTYSNLAVACNVDLYYLHHHVASKSWNQFLKSNGKYQVPIPELEKLLAKLLN